MGKSFWDNLVHNLEKIYYTELIWLLAMIIALCIGIKNYRKEINYILLLLYVLFGIIFITSTIIIRNSLAIPRLNKPTITELLNMFFSLIEISIFLYLFKSFFVSKFEKKLILIIWIIDALFILSISIYICSNEIYVRRIIELSMFVTSINFVILFFLSLFYFYKLLAGQIQQTCNLIYNPVFWVIGGLFFYALVSLPVLLLSSNIAMSNKSLYYILYSIHYISISILYLCIAKAFSCKAPITT